MPRLSRISANAAHADAADADECACWEVANIGCETSTLSLTWAVASLCTASTSFSTSAHPAGGRWACRRRCRSRRPCAAASSFFRLESAHALPIRASRAFTSSNSVRWSPCTPPAPAGCRAISPACAECGRESAVVGQRPWPRARPALPQRLHFSKNVINPAGRNRRGTCIARPNNPACASNSRETCMKASGTAISAPPQSATPASRHHQRNAAN